MSVTATGESIHRQRRDAAAVSIDLSKSPPSITLGQRQRAEFTPRQREILALVARGLGNAEIASMLGISRRTVEKHVEAIHMRAGTSTRARLVAFAATGMRENRF